MKALSLFTWMSGATLVFASMSFAADPIRVMLLDGESGGPYHKWKLITPVLQKQLEETGLFHVDVMTAPPAGGDFAAFKPDFSKSTRPFRPLEQLMGVFPAVSRWKKYRKTMNSTNSSFPDRISLRTGVG